MRARIRTESWSIRGGFRIARGEKAAAEVVVCELFGENAVGLGESVPYRRYGESVESVVERLELAAAALQSGSIEDGLRVAGGGAARNALDCAWWDLRARESGTPAWALAGLMQAPEPLSTMRTVSVDTPESMHDAAAALGNAAVIKVKVDGCEDLARIEAVHAAATEAELVVDANESWTADQTKAWLPELARFGVAVLEQPLPAEDDSALDDFPHPVPICADESFHTSASFDRLRGRYEMVNVKLDKAGGLTEALACVKRAQERSIQTMVGCMVSTSLAVEPALLLTGRADYVDLDGPLLLEHDRGGARHDRRNGILRPSPEVWGGA
jgi:L-alanine-DL-glutamate epimerase-like enolase superfamily enzyme